MHQQNGGPDLFEAFLAGMFGWIGFNALMWAGYGVLVLIGIAGG